VLLVAVLVLCTQIPAWLVVVQVLRSARDERRVRADRDRAIGERLLGQDRQMGDLTRAIGLLVPPEARPTRAHRGPSARDAPRLPPPPVEPASAPAAVAAPRMRVDIRRSSFLSDRVVCYGTERGESLVVDARDVDEREGTVRVEVVDAASFTDRVLVHLPPEHVPRGPLGAARGALLPVGAPRSTVAHRPQVERPPGRDRRGRRTAAPGSLVAACVAAARVRGARDRWVGAPPRVTMKF
jgi:hypothetical protein